MYGICRKTFHISIYWIWAFGPSRHCICISVLNPMWPRLLKLLKCLIYAISWLLNGDYWWLTHLTPPYELLVFHHCSGVILLDPGPQSLLSCCIPTPPNCSTLRWVRDIDFSISRPCWSEPLIDVPVLACLWKMPLLLAYILLPDSTAPPLLASRKLRDIECLNCLPQNEPLHPKQSIHDDLLISVLCERKQAAYHTKSYVTLTLSDWGLAILTKGILWKLCVV